MFDTNANPTLSFWSRSRWRRISDHFCNVCPRK